MEAIQRQQLIRQLAVAKYSLRRMQTLIKTGDRKPNDIQVKFHELPKIYNKCETAQNELQMSDDTDYSVDSNNLNTNTLNLRQSSVNFYIL